VSKVMEACKDILSSFCKEEGSQFDYKACKDSEKWQNFKNTVQLLQLIEPSLIPDEEKRLLFFINVYNLLCIQGIIELGRPDNDIGRLFWFSKVKWIIGGFVYSLNEIENGILRCNRRGPYQLSSVFSGDEYRHAFAGVANVDPRIHFALNCAAVSCPRLRFYDLNQSADEQLTSAAQDFFSVVNKYDRKGGLETSMILSWYNTDFAPDVLNFMKNYLPENQKELFDSVKRVSYTTYNWTLNSSSDS
jgi:hypothetical protein